MNTPGTPVPYGYCEARGAGGPLEVFDEQPIRRAHPGNSPSGEGYGLRWRKQQGGTGGQRALDAGVQRIDLVAEVMQAAAALEKPGDAGLRRRRFHQLDHRGFGRAVFQERNPNRLDWIVKHLPVPAQSHAGDEAVHRIAD